MQRVSAPSSMVECIASAEKVALGDQWLLAQELAEAMVAQPLRVWGFWGEQMCCFGTAAAVSFQGIWSGVHVLPRMKHRQQECQTCSSSWAGLTVAQHGMHIKLLKLYLGCGGID